MLCMRSGNLPEGLTPVAASLELLGIHHQPRLEPIGCHFQWSRKPADVFFLHVAIQWVVCTDGVNTHLL